MAKKGTQPAVQRVSSTTSTGGAGTLFEQQVDAAFLALLLVGGRLPILLDCILREVHLQTEHQGWSTDDIFLVGENGGGTRRRLVCQVKLTFTVSASDQVCKDAIGDFWDDFSGNADFSADNDRLALITLRGTNTLLGHFASLLDTARASRDARDFEHRLQTPGFVNATVVRYFSEIQTIVSERVGRPVTVDALWPFLKVLNVFSLDLNTPTRQTEALYKTLLAHTATGGDPMGAADATWSALVQEAGDGMTQGKSYQRSDLSQVLLERHSPVPDASKAGLRRLSEHSEVILNGIRSTIGPDVHLTRDQLVQSLLEKLEETQVVLVTGPAGGGKSGVAKAAVLELEDHFTFSFRAEEFATAHLDESLHNSQIPANASMLAALMAGQSRKLLLVESVERLLEASTRDAFSDLINLIKKDRSWRLILTCRDYSSELVRTSLLQHAGVQHLVLDVRPLSDAELNDVAAEVPQLTRLLSNPNLRQLLRNPYLLDKASQMDWPADRPLPEDERAFRDKFWAEVIRAEDRPAADMPRRRQETVVEIALRRARALTQYVKRGDLDSEAIRSLRNDSLIMHPEGTEALVAPAHDVLEDWAILEWIEEQYAICSRSLQELAPILGTYPAIRRTYRKWVSEIVERDSQLADSLFASVVGDSSLPSQFRDDTLVALLHSSVSGNLLQRHSTDLFANNRQILRRIIHLLRVACVTTPPWLGGAGAVASIMHVPEGTVWAAILRLIAENLESLEPSDLPLLVGLAEDAARGVNWQTPYPEGAEYISRIANWLLPHFEGYRSEAKRKRVLKIIAKLPKCNREDFSKLLAGDTDVDGRDRLSDDFRKLVLWSMEGMAACRDMPDEVIAAVRDELLITEEMLRGRYSYGGLDEVDDAFGITHSMHHECFPASAYHGPWLQLLRYHPRKAISSLIDLFNYIANWYGTNRVPVRFVEPPYEITLRFSDGTTTTQWCNARLWNLYRGTSVGPYVLQSALMALEQWLLSFAEIRPDELDGVLCDILRRTSNAALTAVVASIATANPRLSPETLIALLSSPDCILFDRTRMSAEYQATALSNMMPFRTSEQRLADEERRQSNALKHRRHDLEAAIANVQLGPHAERVHKAIDAHRAAIPPSTERSEDDRIWWLALHRMDLRQYTVASPYQEPSQEESQEEPSAENEHRMIRLDLREAEPDVQHMMDSSREDHDAMNARLSVLMWGIKVLSREEEDQYAPSLWRTRLEEAKNFQTPEDDEFAFGCGAPEHVASVCIRDHYDEMTDDEKRWCIEVVCAAIESEANNWNEMARMQRYSMGGDRPSAYVLSILMVKTLPSGLEARVENAFACAVLHPIDEVRAYAAAGVGRNIWSSDPALAVRCVNILATEARMVQEQWHTERERPYPERASHAAIEAEAAMQLRPDFYGTVDGHAYEQLNVKDWTGSEANSRILAILCQAPTQELAVNGFRKLAEVLVAWWDEDAERHKGNRDRRERSIDVQIAIASLLEEFVLKATPQQAEHVIEPIVNAVDRHPKEASEILQGIIGSEDRLQETINFWHLWEQFSERVKVASWLADVEREHPEGGPMLAAIFMTQCWKDSTTHWRSLVGYSSRVDALFQALAPSALVLDSYVRFLHHIGEQSLPAAFKLVAARLKAGDPIAMLRMSNTVFLLESMLRKFVYGRPLLLKAERDLREAVLYLLDVLIETGSSSAYRMRDDFVTPAH